MDLVLEVRFGKSSSKYYEKALEHAKKFSDFAPISPGSKSNIVTIRQDELRKRSETFYSLWQLVRNWKSSQLLLNDELANYDDLNSMIRILKCNNEYSKAVIQENHCKIDNQTEGWGCKHLTAINLNLPSGYYYRNDAYWYQFGRLTSEKVWEVDKDKIKELLQRETKLKYLNLCPVFDFEKVEQTVDTLPDKIDLEDSDTWEIQYEENTDGVVVEKKPIGIIPKSSPISIKLTPSDDQASQQQASPINRYIPEVSFQDIGGIDDILETVREVVELPLKKPELFRYLGIKPHKGILLYGPPGCGKTLIAKAIANEVKAHFIVVNGPELLSKWYGESEKNLRNIFREARDLQPSIIFFDEIDSLAQKRSGEETVRLESRLVNQLLTLMDGVEAYENVCVVGSTNRVELLDEALLRPGRFDYNLEVKKPTKQGCYKIIEIHTRHMPIANNLDLKGFSDRLFGLSGAQIAFVAREGAYNCLRRNIDLRQIIEEELIHDIDYSKFVITEEDFLLALRSIKDNKETA